MPRARQPLSGWALALCGTLLLTAAGCIPQLIATGIYLVDGGNMVAAEYEGLEGQRTVVVCRSPASHEFRHAYAAEGIAREISFRLMENVPDIDVVDTQEVDNWNDQGDWEDFKGLARAVNAEKLVFIQLERFDLYKGQTVYQGNALGVVTVYDMTSGERKVWERRLDEILYPRNSGIPVQGKTESQFQREFERHVAETIAVHFYRHDPHAAFAIDALANR